MESKTQERPSHDLRHQPIGARGLSIDRSSGWKPMIIHDQVLVVLLWLLEVALSA
jgi:hypothetical protein